MPPSLHSQRSNTTSGKQSQSSTTLAQRLLLPNGSTKLQPIFATPIPQELTAELYDFIALALRAFVLPWWSKITRYDKEFLPQITHILSHVFRSLEARILLQSSSDEFLALVFQDVPLIIRQHYQDFRNARSKVNSSYSSGGSLSLERLFHQLQPHMAVDAEGKINHEYVRQLIDHVLKVCLPEEDHGPEAERAIVREIVVKIVTEDVLPKVTKPWFIYKIILDLVDDKPENSSIPSPTPSSVAVDSAATSHSASTSSSSGPFSSLLILLLSTIQSISGACLALVHAYKRLVTTVKEVNASTRSTHELEKEEKKNDTEFETTSSSEQELKRTSIIGGVPPELSMPGTPLPLSTSGDYMSVSRVSSTSSSVPSTLSAQPNPPKETVVPVQGTSRGYAFPILLLVSEVFLLDKRHASRTIMGTLDMLISALNTEGFVDRLISHILNRNVLTANTLLTIVRSAKKALFPNGYPQPAPPDPTPEETEEMRRRIITIFTRNRGMDGKGPGKAVLNAIKLMLGSDIDQTIESALEPLGNQACNMHLIIVLVDRVVCGIWPELLEG